VGELLISSRGLHNCETLLDAYDLCCIDEDLESDAQAMCENLKLSDFSVLLNKDKDIKKTILEYILSAVGDDEHTTTESQSMGPLLIVAGPRISKVKLSLKDTGISRTIGNYAEGWILVPPTAESSFESVNRRHLCEGVLFVLDGVKLKLISPVRKMSQLDLDMESKMRKVSETASWVNSH